MKKITISKLHELMQSGIYSGCLAIVNNKPNKDYSRYFVSAISKFKATKTLDVAKDDLQYLSKIQNQDEYLVVFGLDKIERQSSKAHRIRTAIDIRRNKGKHTLIDISKAAFEHHFYDPKSPFYLFCDNISVENITEIDVDNKKS